MKRLFTLTTTLSLLFIFAATGFTHPPPNRTPRPGGPSSARQRAEDPKNWKVRKSRPLRPVYKTVNGQLVRTLEPIPGQTPITTPPTPAPSVTLPIAASITTPPASTATPSAPIVSTPTPSDPQATPTQTVTTPAVTDPTVVDPSAGAPSTPTVTPPANPPANPPNNPPGGNQGRRGQGQGQQNQSATP